MIANQTIIPVRPVRPAGGRTPHGCGCPGPVRAVDGRRRANRAGIVAFVRATRRKNDGRTQMAFEMGR